MTCKQIQSTSIDIKLQHQNLDLLSRNEKMNVNKSINVTDKLS